MVEPDFWVLPVLLRLDESAIVAPHADGRAPEAALRLSFEMSCFRGHPQDRFWRSPERPLATASARLGWNQVGVVGHRSDRQEHRFEPV